MHTSHGNGLSPVWVLICLCKDDCIPNLLLHKSHSKALIFLWTQLTCLSKSCFLVKVFPQISHDNFFSIMTAWELVLWSLFFFPSRVKLGISLKTWKWKTLSVNSELSNLLNLVISYNTLHCLGTSCQRSVSQPGQDILCGSALKAFEMKW